MQRKQYYTAEGISVAFSGFASFGRKPFCRLTFSRQYLVDIAITLTLCRNTFDRQTFGQHVDDCDQHEWAQVSLLLLRPNVCRPDGFRQKDVERFLQP